jgi:4-hydroxy-tetrahydrodipicolinate synthase
MASYRKQDAQEWAWEHLKGQWTTVMTPFTPDDEIDEAGLRRNIRHIRSLGTRGGGVTWGMGEFWSLTHDERLHVMDIAADEAAGKWPIAAHVTHTSYKDAIALAKHAENAGFDLLILAPPYLVAKTENAVVEFTRKIAENTNLAIMFYNSPQFGITVTSQGLQRVCEIPNVVGVKEATPGRDLSLATHLALGRTKIISTPFDWIYFAGKQMGFNQQVMFANTSDWRFDQPGKNYYVQFIDKASRGQVDTEHYELYLRRVSTVSDKWWAYTAQKFGTWPATLCKYWGELMGMAGGHVRAPLLPFTQEEKDTIKGELKAIGHHIAVK